MSSEDGRWFDSWRASHYDPARRQVVIVGNPPHYVIAHEWAHAEQHEKRTLTFCAWQLCTRLVALLHQRLELDAHHRAGTKLRLAGYRMTEEDYRALRLMLEAQL